MHCFFPSICLSLYYHVISITWPFCFQGTWNGILAGGFVEDFVSPQEALLLRLKKKKNMYLSPSLSVLLPCSPLHLHTLSTSGTGHSAFFSGIYQVLFWLFLSYSDPFHTLNRRFSLINTSQSIVPHLPQVLLGIFISLLKGIRL